MGLENTQGMSADEIAVLEGDALDGDGLPRMDDDERAAEANARRDPEGDDDGTDPAADAGAPAQAPAAAPTPAAQAPAPAPTPAEPAAAAVTEPEGDATDAPAPQYLVQDRSQAITDERKTLRAEKLAVDAKWTAGELSDEDRATQLATIDDKLDELLVEQTQARTLREANEQHRRQQHEDVLKQVAVRAKANDGLDYGDQGLGLLYDAKLSEVTKDEAFKAKPFAQQAAEAHARVLKAIGKTAAAPAPAPASAPADVMAARAVDKAKIPPTLSRVPPAATASISGNEFAHLDNLDGAALEREIAKLTPEQQERWLN